MTSMRRSILHQEFHPSHTQGSLSHHSANLALIVPSTLYWLVVSTHLKNISQIGLLFPIYGQNKKCSKPPTSLCRGQVGQESAWCPQQAGQRRLTPAPRQHRAASGSSNSSRTKRDETLFAVQHVGPYGKEMCVETFMKMRTMFTVVMQNDHFCMWVNVQQYSQALYVSSILSN